MLKHLASPQIVSDFAFQLSTFGLMLRLWWQIEVDNNTNTINISSQAIVLMSNNSNISVPLNYHRQIHFINTVWYWPDTFSCTIDLKKLTILTKLMLIWDFMKLVPRSMRDYSGESMSGWSSQCSQILYAGWGSEIWVLASDKLIKIWVGTIISHPPGN